MCTSDRFERCRTYEYEGTGDIDSLKEFGPLLVGPELLKALGHRVESDRNDEEKSKADELDNEADLHGLHAVQGCLVVVRGGVRASHDLGNKCSNVTGNEEWCCCMFQSCINL